MSVAEPWSLDHTSTTAPTWLWRITPISGPGQAIPRASITWSVATSVTAIPPHSDEDQLAVGGEHEGRDALDVVHQRVQVAPVQAEHRAPVLPATGGQQPPHRGGTVGSRFICKRVGVGEVAGPERIQGPVVR